MYQRLIRPLLFSIDAEKVHHLVFKALKTGSNFPGVKSLLSRSFGVSDSRLKQKLFGLEFSNPVGMAAGFDKDAKLVDELALLGFGFIEIGTLTPRPQSGNDKPRLFRLPQDQALINRMGFNNEGVTSAVARLKNRKSRVIVGGNIGKNKTTPNEQAFDDYGYCVDALHDYVDYFVVNVSSPNTPGLRELQEKEPLQKLLMYVKEKVNARQKQKPVLLKIAPDLADSQLNDIVEILKITKIDGVIATNTTISRDGLVSDKATVDAIGAGGLSGLPLKEKSTHVIRHLRSQLGADFPIIGVGGIMDPEDAIEKLQAGANLVQVYTGFIYQGPGFAKKINEAILNSKVLKNQA